MVKDLSTFFTALTHAQQMLAVDIYFVGGCVRDALLGEISEDLDLVTSADLDQLSAVMHAWDFERSFFNTLSINIQGKQIDLSTFRKECYNDESGLPQVFPGSIEDDIFRRDFTVNTGYVRLSEESIAYFSRGANSQRMQTLESEIAYSHPMFRADLQKRLLRILHHNSFKEDATRMLRAVKYTTVKGFFVEADTQSALEQAVKDRVIDRCSKVRVRQILLDLANSPQGTYMILKCIKWGVLPHMQASDDAAEWNIKIIERDMKGLLKRLKEKYPSTFEAVNSGLLALLYVYRDHLDFFSGAGRPVQKLVMQCRQIRLIHMEEPQSLYEHLRLAQPECVVFAILDGVLNEARFDYYKAYLEGIRIELSGEDLKALGFKEGPEIGDILKRLLRVQIANGENYSKEKEIKWIESIYNEYGY